MNPNNNANKIYCCKVCNKKLKNNKSLSVHMLLHDEPCFTCEICNNYKTSRKDAFQRHQKSAHNTGTGIAISCLFCNKQVFSQTDLEFHLRTHTRERPYFCKHCRTECSQPGELKIHMSSHNPNRTQNFHCKICAKSFYVKSNLTNHVRIHAREKRYKCEFCPKGFVLKEYLDNHMKVHLKEKPYKCEICDARFLRKPYLMSHIRFHTKEKPFACKTCKKTFALKQSLLVHERIHTGEKPYPCNKCERSFSQSAHLKNHTQRVHALDSN